MVKMLDQLPILESISQNLMHGDLVTMSKLSKKIRFQVIRNWNLIRLLCHYRLKVCTPDIYNDYYDCCLVPENTMITRNEVSKYRLIGQFDGGKFELHTIYYLDINREMGLYNMVLRKDLYELFVYLMFGCNDFAFIKRLKKLKMGKRYRDYLNKKFD